jgi:hypothetical protein
MTEHEASRTLVKSPPELWAECSDAGSLARHLMGSFGEIHITRLEPETAVAWEGEHVSGTVRLEPSGWGTRVVLTAAASVTEAANQATEAASVPNPPPEPDPEPDPDPDPDPDPLPEPDLETAAAAPAQLVLLEPSGRTGLFARLRRAFKGGRATDAAGSQPPPAVNPQPEVESPPEADPSPGIHTTLAINADAALAAALDSLGQAHHRPFSRA